MKKVKNEKVFTYFASKELDCIPTETGREQFYEKQSNGITPENPDQYYTFLMFGKQSFDFLSREYQQMYFNGEWWGWLTMWFDWKDNWDILKKVCSWHKNVPSALEMQNASK